MKGEVKRLVAVHYQMERASDANGFQYWMGFMDS